MKYILKIIFSFEINEIKWCEVIFLMSEKLIIFIFKWVCLKELLPLYNHRITSWQEGLGAYSNYKGKLTLPNTSTKQSVKLSHEYNDEISCRVRTY